MLDTTTTLAPILRSTPHPGMLPVSSLHTIAWEQAVTPRESPSWSSMVGQRSGQPSYRQYFDPTVLNIVQLDQRGAVNPRRMPNWRTTPKHPCAISRRFVSISALMLGMCLEVLGAQPRIDLCSTPSERVGVWCFEVFSCAAI